MKLETRQRFLKAPISQGSSFADSPLITIKSHQSFGLSEAKNFEKENKEKNIIKCGIDNKYLNPIHYLSTCEFAKRRNLLHRQYCTNIGDYYAEFNLLYEKCTQKTTPKQVEKQQKYSFILEFKSFINEFFSIFKEVSSVQIGFFQSLKDDIARRQQVLEWNTNQFIDKLQSYKKSQTQFQQRAKVHKDEMQDIYSKYQNLKKDEKDPYAFFNRKSQSKKATEILQSLKKQQKIRQDLRKDLDEVFDNSAEFENNLVLYRQQLFNNKYKIMKKLTEISKSSRNSLAQFLVYLFECVSRKNQDYNKLIKKSHDPTLRKRTKSFTHIDDKLAIESYLVQVTNQYNRTIQEIQSVIKNLNEIFQQLRKFTTNQIQSKRKILQLMNSVYDVDENPDNQVSKTLNFYQDFCTKIYEINNGINIASNQLTKLKKESVKLAEITLSLVRNSKSSLKNFDANFNESSHTSQIQILLQKLSYDYPVTLIHNIYKDFQKNLTYLKNDASQRFHMKKRRIADSMEISHIEDQTVVKPKKRICKKQIWLWEKWQNQYDYKIDEFKVASLAQIKEFANKITVEIPDGKQVDRFSCSLQIKGQPAGFLIITDKYIKFQTSQGSCILLVLLEQIEDVKIAVKMFGKLIVINTPNGPVCFRGCIDVQKVFQSIEQVRNNSGAPMMKPPRSTVQVTVQQLAFMEQRKMKIKGQLPKFEDYTFVEQATIEDITIDHLYQLIYSDKQVNIRGKVEPNFFGYTMKKNGASNFEVTKYDSIGPRFFTHEEGVTFLNCPVFSMRIMNYDVKLPPVPFMPKYAHNQEECKIFWVSNEEFHYLVHNNTSGAPKAETFFVQILHKVQKKDQKSTKISIYWRIFFLEDSFLKSTIQSSATQQTKKGIGLTLADIKKYCHQVSASSSGDHKGSQQLFEKEQQTQAQKDNGSSGQGFIGQMIEMLTTMIKKIAFKQKPDQTKGDQKKGKQKNQGKGMNILIIILTVVLFMNLVVHFFKSDK